MCVEGIVSECCMLVDVGKISIISNRGVITQPRDPDPISHHTTPGHRETLEFFQFDIDTDVRNTKHSMKPHFHVEIKL